MSIWPYAWSSCALPGHNLDLRAGAIVSVVPGLAACSCHCPTSSRAIAISIATSASEGSSATLTAPYSRVVAFMSNARATAPGKRRRLTRATSEVSNPAGGAQIESLACSVRKHNHATQMKRVWEAMHKDSELTANLHYMVEMGKFSRSASGPSDGMLPQSCNKFSMMRADRKEAILRAILGSKLPKRDDLFKFRKNQKNFLDAALCSVLSVEITCAVFSKDMSELSRLCVRRAQEVKSPLLTMGSMAGGVDWQKHGAFKFVNKVGGHYKQFLRVKSGDEVDLADFGHTVDDSWKFEKNWDTWKAKIVTGKVAMLCFKLFDKEVHKSKAFRPLRLPRVPTKSKVQQVLAGVGCDFEDECTNSQEDVGVLADAATEQDVLPLVGLHRRPATAVRCERSPV